MSEPSQEIEVPHRSDKKLGNRCHDLLRTKGVEDATSNKKLRSGLLASLLRARKLLGAPGLTTGSKDATRSTGPMAPMAWTISSMHEERVMVETDRGLASPPCPERATARSTPGSGSLYRLHICLYYRDIPVAHVFCITTVILLVRKPFEVAVSECEGTSFRSSVLGDPWLSIIQRVPRKVASLHLPHSFNPTCCKINIFNEKLEWHEDGQHT